MPIHDLGYRRWEGRTTPEAFRFWVITQTGIKIVWKNFWLRRLLFVAWLPTFYFGAGFFIYEQWLTRWEQTRQERSAAARVLEQRAREMIRRRAWGPAAAPSGQAAAADAVAAQMKLTALTRAQRQLEGLLPGLQLSEDRHHMWCWFMWMFFRHPQGLLMLLVVGLVAPPLIARDVGSRAFLLYFSRPINRVEYLMGKLSIVWCFVLLISMLPALVLYVLGVMLSPDLSVVGATWDLPFRILLASFVLIVPTTTMALALSSATTKSMIAGFVWFAVWAFGFAAYSVLWMSVTVQQQGQGPGLDASWMLLSLYHTLGRVQAWVFGVEGGLAGVLPFLGLLTGLTVVSLMVLFRRISSPMRI